MGRDGGRAQHGAAGTAALCCVESGPRAHLKAASLEHLVPDAGCRLGLDSPPCVSLIVCGFPLTWWVPRKCCAGSIRLLSPARRLPPESCWVTSATFSVRGKSLRPVHIEGREMSLPLWWEDGSR